MAKRKAQAGQGWSPEALKPGDEDGPRYLQSLDVENIRCFGPRQELDFCDDKGIPRQWTVLLGDNGVGKTTMLQLLACFGTKSWASEQNSTHPTIYLNGVQRLLRSGKEAGRASVRLFPRSGPDAPSDLLLETSPSGANWEAPGLIFFGYGGARRMSLTSLQEDPWPQSLHSLFDDEAPLLNPEEWLLEADYAAAKDSPVQARARSQRNRIREVLVQLLPDVEDVRIEMPTERVSRPHVEFKTPYGWVELGQLSLGYRTLTAWMVDLAARLYRCYPDSPNPLAEPAIVLVDEIDLHLHPRWQRTLMAYLSERFPQTQFIVTAHSPLVVQAAEDANVVLLRQEDDHVVIDNNPGQVAGWRADQILTSELFGLDSARPPKYEEIDKERVKLLSKKRLTAKDKARIKELDAALGAYPTAERPEDIEAMALIRQAAERLKGKKGAG